MNLELKTIEETIKENTFWDKLTYFLHRHIDFTEKISISIQDILLIITVIFITTLVLKLVLKLITRNLPKKIRKNLR